MPRVKSESRSSVPCRSCGAPCVWVEVRTQAGEVKPMLCDIECQMRVCVMEGDDEPGRVLRTYRSHFSTCPDAEKWRSRK